MVGLRAFVPSVSRSVVRPLMLFGVPLIFRIAGQMGSDLEGMRGVGREYTKYKPEFRDEVAKLVVESNRSIAEVAREYGLGVDPARFQTTPPACYRSPLTATGTRRGPASLQISR
jgi:hypothetical protein